MAYKYDSALKHFTYSKESYKIISDFLLSGEKSNPDIKLKVNSITKFFKSSSKPLDWFRLSTTKAYISALINIKLENEDKKLERIIREWIQIENVDKTVFSTKVVNNHLCCDSDKTTFFDNSRNIFGVHLEMLKKSDDKKFIKLLKSIGMISVKKGNAELTKSVSGTWINRDLAVKYAEWLDPKFSIWISQKILELVNDGVSWNEIRDTTKMDYKPLILAIEKYIMPLHPIMDENIIKGQIANYINLKVMGQKAKEIRANKKIKENELTRDYFKELELKRVEKVQIFAEMLISQFDIYDFKTLEEKISKFKF